MKAFRLFFLSGVVLLLVSVLLQPTFSHALSTMGGGSGPTAAPTASPAPALVAATATVAPGANPSPAISVGVQAGDCAILCTNAIGASGTGALTYSISSNTQGWAYWQFGKTWTVSNYTFNMYWRTMTPQDITAGTLTLTGVPSGVPVGLAYFRHVTCMTDSNNNAVATAASTSPQAPSQTNTLNGDLNVLCTTVNASGTDAYTSPTGYTNATNMAATVSANGVAIDYKVLGAAGTVAPGAGTLNSSGNWGVSQMTIPNLGSTQ